MPLNTIPCFPVPDREPSLLPEDREWRLAFHDEFDGDALDTTTWSYRTNFGGRRASWFAVPEDGCSFFVDGVQRGPKIGREPGEAVSRTECFLLVSTELKGFRGDGAVETSMDGAPEATFAALADADAFEVDYVRVFDPME
ncbi:MAG: hypothetical protein ACOX5G_13065 [Kiritimatiellia bacterium]